MRVGSVWFLMGEREGGREGGEVETEGVREKWTEPDIMEKWKK